MKTFGKICLGIIIGAVVSFVVAITCIPSTRAMWNNYLHTMHEVDDHTTYKTKKEVEDTCRAMISSYTSDKLTYDQYKGDTSIEKRSWAEQAKMRANRTAATYNEYILKNNYVFDTNVPYDIKMQLEYLE